MKLMIVDDDQQFREGIRYGVDWAQLRINQVEDFANGEEALLAYHDFLPDIILSDIKMPKMDGISLLKEIRKIDQRVCFVLFSAYDDFHYCKEAIKLGANDYELKPVKASALIATISKCIETLEKNDNSIQKFSNRKYQNNMIREIFLTDEDWDRNIVKEFLRKEYKLEKIDRLFVVCSRINNWNGLKESEKSNTKKLVEEKFKECIQENESAYIDLGNEFCIGLYKTESCSILTSFNQIYEVKKKIENMNRELLKRGVLISAGISPSYSLHEIRTAYEKSKVALEWAFYHTDNPAIAYQEDMMPQKKRKQDISDISYLSLFEQEALTYLVHGKSEKIKDCIDRLEERILTEKPSVNDIKQLLYKTYLRLTIRLGNQWDCHIPDFSKYHSLSLCMDILRNDFMKIADENKEALGKTGFSKLVLEAMDYIEMHYTEDLSVGAVAECIQITPNYLSNIFKKETNHNIKDYIKELRLHKAKELMLSTNMTIQEIACQVGYCDYIYFSRIFKNKYGKSASEIRGK